MKNTLKTYLRFCSYGLFYLAVTFCLVGIFLTTLSVVGIARNFDVLWIHYTIVSLSSWFLTLAFIVFKKGRQFNETKTFLPS